MTIVKLIHPEHGIVMERKVDGKFRLNNVQQKFRNLYGKKFDECTVEYQTISTTNNIISRQMGGRKIKNLQTGELYNSRQEAKKAVGLSTHQLYTHLYRKLKREYYYKVAWY